MLFLVYIFNIFVYLNIFVYICVYISIYDIYNVLYILYIYIPKYYLQSAKNVPGFFSESSLNSCTQKTNKYIIDKGSKHKWRKLFLRVSTVCVNFVFYPLSSTYFTSSLFVPTYFFDSASASDRVRRCPILVRHNKY